MDEDERDYDQESFGKALFELVDDPRAHDVDMVKALTNQLCRTIAVDDLGERTAPAVRRDRVLRVIAILMRDCVPYREIVWNSMGPMIDEREPPEGLAEGGLYKVHHDARGYWLVDWFTTEEVFSPLPRGTNVGVGSSFAEVKAIAERDYESRRQHSA